jgi:YD repeat-containing protein
MAACSWYRWDVLICETVANASVTVSIPSGYDSYLMIWVARNEQHPELCAERAETVVTNVTSLSSFDGLGRTLTTTDPTGAVTTMAYDGLSRTQVITNAVGRVTRQGYDGTGALRWSQTPDGA